MWRLPAFLLLATLSGGCTLTPDYERPELDVPETYITRLKVGQKISLDFNSIGVKTSASISQVGDFINPDSRTFKVNVNLPSNGQFGEFCCIVC